MIKFATENDYSNNKNNIEKRFNYINSDLSRGFLICFGVIILLNTIWLIYWINYIYFFNLKELKKFKLEKIQTSNLAK